MAKPKPYKTTRISGYVVKEYDKNGEKVVAFARPGMKTEKINLGFANDEMIKNAIDNAITRFNDLRTTKKENK